MLVLQFATIVSQLIPRNQLGLEGAIEGFFRWDRAFPGEELLPNRSVLVASQCSRCFGLLHRLLLIGFACVSRRFAPVILVTYRYIHVSGYMPAKLTNINAIRQNMKFRLETSGAACALHHRADAFAIRLQLLQMKTSKMANSSWHRATQRVAM